MGVARHRRAARSVLADRRPRDPVRARRSHRGGSRAPARATGDAERVARPSTRDPASSRRDSLGYTRAHSIMAPRRMTVLMPFHTPFYAPLAAGVALGHF